MEKERGREETVHRHGGREHDNEETSRLGMSSGETDLERGWDNVKGKTKEGWRDVREATRDAWYRVRGH